MHGKANQLISIEIETPSDVDMKKLILFAFVPCVYFLLGLLFLLPSLFSIDHLAHN